MDAENFKRKVSALKRKLVESAKEVQSINEKGRAALNVPAQVNTFKGMFKVLEKYYSKFETYWDELIDLHEDEEKTAEFPIDADLTLQIKTKRYYYEAHSSYETLVQTTSPPSRQSINPNESVVSEVRSNKVLPRINLPHFNGQITNWPKFRDAFISIIHNDALLTKMEKFHYLVSSLVGTASAVISNLPLIEDNYDLAWKALNDTFNNKRMLASNYLNQLIGFKPQQGKPTIDSLQTFVSQVSDNIAAFKLLKIPNEADFVLFHIAVRLLDPVTREQFELQHKEKNFPVFDDLTKFLRERCLALQLAQGNTHQSTHESKSANTSGASKGYNLRSSNRGMRATLLANSSGNNMPVKDSSKSPACFLCNNDGHILSRCKDFINATVDERHKMLKNWRGCKNCLWHNHTTGKCFSKWTCKFCRKKHHSLLHIPTSTDEETNDSTTSTPTSSLTATLPQHSNILLGTVVAEIKDASGRFQPIRLVIDSGSQHSFITHKCVNKLGLSTTPFPKKISAIGQTIFDGAKGKALCLLKPKNKDSPILKTEAVVINNITSYLPNFNMPSSLWSEYTKFELADPKFWEPGPIEFLLGSDLFPDIWLGPSITLHENQPKLFESVFGYIAIGRVPDCQSSSNMNASFFTLAHDEYDIHKQLQQFWELEEPAPIPAKESPEDLACEKHFTETHYRLETGQYVVRLPFKDEPRHLGDSERNSLKRLYSLETKLRKNPQLKSEYCKFMRDYHEMAHMSPTSSASKYVIPHHAVTKEDRSHIKLRVVFDASSLTGCNSSLNNHLMIGPKLQQDIRSILTRFRMYPVVFVADVIKMYRQILVDPSDRVYQHIFWRFDPSEAIQKYELNTVTYGTTSAPFLALRVMKQLAIDEGSDYPHAAKAILQDMYVDDLVTGAYSVDEALKLKDEVISLLHKGTFMLSKWASNCQDILKSIDPSNHTAQINLSYGEESVKILGLQWNPSSDTFAYKIEKFTPVFTKRSILSTVAKIFDPLGFLSPVIMIAKGIIQSLWKLKLDWDTEIPTTLKILWNDLTNQLENLQNLSIPRFVASEKPYRLQIVGFADASERGYCAALYLRVISDKITTNLLTAKTKLAPIKTLSIPRLELCGAYLLATLFHSTMETFSQFSNQDFQKPIFFTDSSIVLGWLNTPTYKLKVFVANRVTHILDNTPASSWRHVKSEENPSDYGSRGLLPHNLANCELWWHGPKWMNTPEAEWPESAIQYQQPLPEVKTEPQVLIANSTELKFIELMENYSSYYKLLTVISWIRRFTYNCRAKLHNTSQLKGPLQPKEIQQSLYFCIKIIQSHFFSLDGSQQCKTTALSKFHKLAPFFDKLGILRVGGRLNKATIPEDQRHPILLPKCHFTLLLVDYYHKIHLHPGPNLLQALIQLKFWIPSLRNLVRQRTFKCLKCFKLKAETFSPKMADLPSPRVNVSRAFLHVGVDFAGPLTLRESLRRKAATTKTYICVFVCMATKALHLELVTALSTDAFMASFKRFISRRGLPEQMYSDCGTNFKGAANRLRELGMWFSNQTTQEEILQQSTKLDVKWNFNPPYSPHFGGLWESAVKSAKTHLRKVAGETALTYEEWSTLLAQIEAVLNSRPLCPLSASPEETNFLSPGHFLIGCPLVAPPEPSLLDLRENLLSRWQIIQKMVQHFWKRWRVEYLNTLQARGKWTRPSANPEIGDLVLLKDQNVPVLQWPLGRIIKTHPGSDGVVRVVTVKTSDSEFQRPAVKLVPLLPINSDPFE